MAKGDGDLAEQLTLAEQLILLAIDPRTGRLHERPPDALGVAVAGAILSDLLEDGTLSLIDNKVAAQRPAQETLSAALLKEIELLPPQTLRFWVSALTTKAFRAKEYTIATLIQRGALAIETGRRFGLRDVARYKVLNDALRERAVARLQAAVSSPGGLDSSSISLVTLAASCGLINRFVPRSLRSGMKKRLHAITEGAQGLRGALEDQAIPVGYAIAIEVYAATIDVGQFGGDGGGGHGAGHMGGHGGP